MLPFRGQFDSERHCQSDGEITQTVICEKRCFLEHYKVLLVRVLIGSSLRNCLSTTYRFTRNNSNT